MRPNIFSIHFIVRNNRMDKDGYVWRGQGRILEYQNASGGRYQDRAKAAPLYQKWLSAILH